MSLTLSSFRYLAWVGARVRLQGPVLLLGRQMVFGSAADIAWALRAQGTQPYSLAANCDGPNIPGLDLSLYGQYTNDTFALKMLLGDTSVTAVDIDGYQGAELVHDITKPLPSAHLRRYGLIVDAGTLEHVLDCKAALDNLIDCLQDGGIIVHMSPSNGYLDHGYFQFSPSFFNDYYRSRMMQVDNITLVEQPARRTNHAQWSFWHWDNALKRKKIMSDNPLATFCVASANHSVCPPAAIHQDFADYLRITSGERRFEKRPWGLEPISDLAPKMGYPLT